MSTVFNVLIAEDDVTSQIGIKHIIEQRIPNSNFFYTKNGKEAIDIFRVTVVDLLCTDINMYPVNGIELVEQVTTKYPNTKIIVCTAFLTIDYIKPLLNYNVSIVYKLNGEINDFLIAIDFALANKKFYSPQIVDYISKVITFDTNKTTISLTETEKKIIEFLILGYLQKQIAEQLNISKRTVENIISNLKKRFGTYTIASLIAKIKEKGLL